LTDLIKIGIDLILISSGVYRNKMSRLFSAHVLSWNTSFIEATCLLSTLVSFYLLYRLMEEAGKQQEHFGGMQAEIERLKGDLAQSSENKQACMSALMQVHFCSRCTGMSV